MFDDFVVLHFGLASYDPPPLDDFWDIIAELDWPAGGPDAFAERANARLSFFEALRFERQINRLGDALEERLAQTVRGTDAEPDDPFWLQDLWDATRHVVGLGRETYDAMMSEPTKLLDVEPAEGLGYVIAAAERALSVDADELDQALRASSTIRAFDAPEGLRAGDVVEHPDLGLGFISFSIATPWMWLIFRDDTLSSQRHAEPARSVTLYRRHDADNVDYWFGSIGKGSENDIFVRTGPLGFRRGGQIVPPDENNDARFDQLVAAAQAEGFGTETPERHPIAARVDGHGLDDDPEEVRRGLDRIMCETGLGSITHLRAARFESMYFGDVVSPRRAAYAVREAWDEPPEHAVYYLGDETKKIVGELAFDLPTPPCEVHEALPYFSRLSITPHPDTAKWATKTARSAGLESFDDIDDRIAELAAQFANGELDDEAVTRNSEQLGAFAGEALRAEVGGDWGVGTLFSERLWYGLLVGEANVRWWPVREVRARIEGTQSGSFLERCRELAERSKTPAPAPIDRMFTLGGDEGYFDAGVTSDGRQALMGAFYDQTFALFFDTDGRLLEYATRPTMPGRPDGQPEYGPSRMALETWHEELGFEPQSISVRRFSCRSAAVGIEDLPSHFEEFLEDPDSFDEEDQQQYPVQIEEWIANGEFVLYWGNDLWLDGDGHVTSS